MKNESSKILSDLCIDIVIHMSTSYDFNENSITITEHSRELLIPKHILN